jgi:subtilisin family serine protease
MEHIVLSTTVKGESEIGLAVGLDGLPSADARGVVFNSRDNYFTVALLGTAVAKLAAGVTLTAGQLVSSNANGEIIPAVAGAKVLGYAVKESAGGTAPICICPTLAV